MAKHGKQDGPSSNKPSSLREALAATASRRQRRAEASRPRTPPASRRTEKRVGPVAPGRSKPAGRSKIKKEKEKDKEKRSRPAARRSPPSISPTPLGAVEPVRLVPVRVPPRGSVFESILRRPAGGPPPPPYVYTGGPPWIWQKKWAEKYDSEGGVWQLETIRRDHGVVTERWEWTENKPAQ